MRGSISDHAGDAAFALGAVLVLAFMLCGVVVAWRYATGDLKVQDRYCTERADAP